MVKVADEPLAAEELVARVRDLLQSDPSPAVDLGASPAPAPNPRIHNMRVALGGLAAPPATAGGGRLRALTGTFVKRSVRRLTAWYVDPRWRAQAIFDEEVTSMAVDLDRFRAQVNRAETDLAAHTAALGEQTLLLEERVTTLAQEVEGLHRQLLTAPEIDYVLFEERFRGSSEELRQIQADYVGRFVASGNKGPVVDIGCGRGEMLELLSETALVGIGVESDPGMLAVCQAKGLDVVGTDGVSWLSAQPDASLGGIFMAQVVEHLPTHDLVALVQLAARKLRAGGLFIAETIDPRSLYAIANFFWADLSHVRPVHPATLSFLAEQAGFGSVEVIQCSRHELADELAEHHDDVSSSVPTSAEDADAGAPDDAPFADESSLDAAAEQANVPIAELDGRTSADRLTTAVRGLLDVVYGFQDYALVATR
jgi:SAM-dependent methyltransferase